MSIELPNMVKIINTVVYIKPEKSTG